MLRVENIAFWFSNCAPAIWNVCFEVEKGEFIGVVGLNGSGKSTLLKLIQRIYSPKSGKIFLSGIDLQQYSSADLAKRVASVPQRLALSFDFTVAQFVMLGRTPYLKFLRDPSKQDEDIVADVMGRCDCLQFAKTSVLKLSTGELQRVCIAIALAQQPHLLLLDEPTSSLDLRQRSRLSRLLLNLQKAGMTILCASHDLPFLQMHAQRLLLLHEGNQIAFGSTSEVISSSSLTELFEIKREFYAR